MKVQNKSTFIIVAKYKTNSNVYKSYTVKLIFFEY